MASRNGSLACPMGRAIPDIVHAPDRLLHPVRREGDAWRRTSWDDALSFMACRLSGIAQRHGPRAISVHLGQSQVSHTYLWYHVERFCRLLGTPNLSSAGSQCHAARDIGNRLTYGHYPSPDYERTRCIVAWGTNPSSTNSHTMKAVLTALNRGARLIVVDPRTTPLAGLADIHLQLRPGTDRALALGMLVAALEERMFDGDFVNRWTVGFNLLQDALGKHTLDTADSITGVPATLIRAAARLYYGTRPACVALGNAIEHQSDGVQAVRAVAILQALSGNLDVPGGAQFNPHHPFGSLPANPPPPDQKAIGAEAHPLFHEFTGEANANLLADAILDENPYPIRGMLVIGANPALTFPNSRRVQQALGRLEFLAVMDLFHTETSRHADLVLPAATFPEKTELCDLRNSGPLTRLSLVPPAIRPQGEAWPEWRLWFELARRLGFGGQFPWRDLEEAIEDHAESLGTTFSELKASPQGVECGAESFRRYESEGFPTPSGKVEFFSERLRQLGCDPMPTGAFGNDATQILVSVGAKPRDFIHSQFRNIPSLRQRRTQAEAEMCPTTAHELGVLDGDTVTIRTRKGEIEIPASVDPGIVPGTVFVPHGWVDANANVLTDDADLDPISGFPKFRAIPCTASSQSRQFEPPLAGQSEELALSAGGSTSQK